MKFNFKKISAIGASVLMTGLTVGVAAAASFPAPFVENGVADVAIVYGTGAGVSSLDMVQAGNIQTELGKSVEGETVVTGGDSYKFEKSSTKLHLGDHYVNVSSTLDEDELADLLATGKYMDDDNDEIDYDQKITMGTLPYLHMFDDDDYKEDSPSVGFRIPSGQTVLTYEINFNDQLLMTDMPTTDLPLMGKTYYVLSNTSTTLTLLDSAASAIVAADETVTLDVDGVTYTVSASIFDTANSKVKLVVNGETTNLLAGTDTQRLSDGAYVGVKEVIVQNFQGGVNQVEFSIGKGKLKLTDGGSTNVQINDNTVNELVSDFSLSANVLSKINITWSADEDEFVAEDSVLTMPGFEAISLSYGGLNYPEEEVIEVKQGGTTYAVLDDFPLKDGPADINFLYGNSTWFQGIGKDSSNVLLTDDNNDGNITFNGNNVHDYFVASWTDTNSAESYLLRFNNIALDSAGTNNRTDLEIYKNGAWSVQKSNLKATDTVTIGNVDLTIGAVSKLGTTRTVEVWRTNADTSTSITSFNTLYSVEGMRVDLPWLNTTALNISDSTNKTAVLACNAARSWTFENDQVGEIGYGGVVTYNNTADGTASGVQTEATVTCTPDVTTFNLKFTEEDRNENKYSGDHFNVTLGWDSSTTAEVEVTDVAGEDVSFVEIGDTDVWRAFMYSALATEMLWAKPDSGQNSIKIMYHGEEVIADALITSADAVTTAGALGDVLVKDSEVSSVASKNLVIVGGSCINSAAATALGMAGPTCGAAFTAATGVGSGEFLIKGVQDAFSSGKLALVVAGYEAADTVNAATYLTKKDVDTSKEYKGTTATEATLVTA